MKCVACGRRLIELDAMLPKVCQMCRRPPFNCTCKKLPELIGQVSRILI